MAKREFHLHDGKKGTALAIRLTPRSRKNEIVEISSDGTIKIRVTSPPIDGKANTALIEFLADVLDVPKSNLEIVAGISGHDKLVSIVDLDIETVHARIVQSINK